MTTYDTTALREKLAKATDGEWLRTGHYALSDDGTHYVFLCIGARPLDERREANAALIVALKNEAPALIDTIDSQAAEIAALAKLLAEITPPRLIGESHSPYPAGKTTILMDWEWLSRARAALLETQLAHDAEIPFADGGKI